MSALKAAMIEGNPTLLKIMVAVGRLEGWAPMSPFAEAKRFLAFDRETELAYFRMETGRQGLFKAPDLQAAVALFKGNRVVEVTTCCQVAVTRELYEGFCRECQGDVCESCAGFYSAEDGYDDDGQGVRRVIVCKACVPEAVVARG